MSLMLAPAIPAEDNWPSARVALSRLAKLATCSSTLPSTCWESVALGAGAGRGAGAAAGNAATATGALSTRAAWVVAGLPVATRTPLSRIQ